MTTTLTKFLDVNVCPSYCAGQATVQKTTALTWLRNYVSASSIPVEWRNNSAVDNTTTLDTANSCEATTLTIASTGGTLRLCL